MITREQMVEGLNKLGLETTRTKRNFGHFASIKWSLGIELSVYKSHTIVAVYAEKRILSKTFEHENDPKPKEVLSFFNDVLKKANALAGKF